MRWAELDNDLLDFSRGNEKFKKYSIPNGGVGRLVPQCFYCIVKQRTDVNGE